MCKKCVYWARKNKSCEKYLNCGKKIWDRRRTEINLLISTLLAKIDLRKKKKKTPIYWGK